MQHISGNDDVILRQSEALQPRVCINVEQRVFDEFVVAAEACKGMAEEDVGDVGEDITCACGHKDRQHARRGTATAGTYFEGSHAVATG